MFFSIDLKKIFRSEKWGWHLLTSFDSWLGCYCPSFLHATITIYNKKLKKTITCNTVNTLVKFLKLTVHSCTVKRRYFKTLNPLIHNVYVNRWEKICTENEQQRDWILRVTFRPISFKSSQKYLKFIASNIGHLFLT